MAQINVTVTEEAYRKAKAKCGIMNLELKEYIEKIILENAKNIYLDKEIKEEMKKDVSINKKV